MTLQNRAVLKSYYETGDYPTQEQFAELIDSMFNKVEDDAIIGLKLHSQYVPYKAGIGSIYGGGLYIALVDNQGTFDPLKWLLISNPSGILEFPFFVNFPVTGQPSTIYLDNHTNFGYRWNGGGYTLLFKLDFNSDELIEGSTNRFYTPARETLINNAIGLKLDASAYNDRFKGKYISSAALIAAHPTGVDGDYAIVNAGSGVDAKEYIWDTEEGWVLSSGTPVTDTDSIIEGATNKYFTAARVRDSLLTGLSTSVNAVITVTDSFLVGFGKLQKQISDMLVTLGLKQNKLTVVAVASANFTASIDTFIPVNTTSGNIIGTLPTAPVDGSRIGIKHIIRGGTNVITITCGGADVFNKSGGVGSLTISLLNQGMILQYKSGIWLVTSADFSLIELDSRYLHNIPTPTLDTDPANKAYVNSKAVDTTQFGFSPDFEKEDSMYYPIIKAEGMNNSTGLANHASGGVVAAVAGVAGTGSISMPKPIDPSKPWCFGVLVEINDGNLIDLLQFSNDAGDFETGMKMTKISTTEITGLFCGNNVLNGYGNTGGIPSATQLWLTMASDGSANVVWSIIPVNYTQATVDIGGGSPPSFNAAWDNGLYCKTQPTNYVQGSKNSFGAPSGAQYKNSLTKFSISTKSTQNRIIGVWCNQGLAAPKDGQLAPPCVLRPTILQDQTAWVLLPGTRSSQPTDVIFVMHPNGNPGTYMFVGSNGNRPEAAKIHKAGYIVCGITGAYNASDYSGMTSSNWGFPLGMPYRKELHNWVRTTVPGTRYFFLYGPSMGGIDSVRYAIEYSNQVKGMYLVSPALGLDDSWNNRGFSVIGQNAASALYQCIQPITGLSPSITINITPAKTIGATTLNCTALTSQIPTGTILTLYSGIGQTTVVTTALANSGATSIQVTALTVDINNNSKYDASYYFSRINIGICTPDILYYKAPFVWRNIYVQANAYIANDVIGVPSTLGYVAYKSIDPTNTPYSLKYIPIRIKHGDADTLIPIAQSISFKSAIDAVGGTCTLIPVVGGTHLSADMFDGTDAVNFFQSLV